MNEPVYQEDWLILVSLFFVYNVLNVNELMGKLIQ